MKGQKEKTARIRTYLSAHGYTGMILARQDNFNRVTGGGDDHVMFVQQ